MSQPTHPNCMIGRRNPRTLTDGCDQCGLSLVYCDSVDSCCPDCSH